MTVNDPRPQLAAALAARLAPEYTAAKSVKAKGRRKRLRMTKHDTS